jgi:hypothetical protein
MVNAMMAALDCTHIVKIIPTKRKNIVFQTSDSQISEKKEVMASLTVGLSAMVNPDSFKVQSPRNKRATPKRNSPTIRNLF